jgi:hypothetical protein
VRGTKYLRGIMIGEGKGKCKKRIDLREGRSIRKRIMRIRNHNAGDTIKFAGE